jgi:hypothetical protein
MDKPTRLLMLVIAAMLLAGQAVAAVCTSQATGNWGTVATWNCGRVPLSTDTVVLASPFTVTLNNSYTTAGLTINAGATLRDTGGRVLTVTGDIVNNGMFTSNNDGIIASTGANAVISGTGTFADTARLYTSGAAPTVAAGSTLNFTGDAQFRVGRDPNGNTVSTSVLTINGTLNATGQTGGTNNQFLRLYSANTIVGSSGVITTNNTGTIEFRNTGSTLTNNGTVTVGNITRNNGSGPWVNGANSSLTVLNSFSPSIVLNASATGNTVTYIAPATPVTPSGNIYYNLGGTGVTCPHTYTVMGTNPCTAPPGSGFVISSPSTCATGPGTIPWTNPMNAIATDNVYATAALAGGSTSNYLNCTGFNFSGIPAGATITGITVNIERKASRNRRARDAFVYLIKGGVVSTAFNGATATQYTTTDVIAPHGGMTSLWGTTWLVTDVQAVNFGVAYAVTTSRGLTVSVDHVQVRIDYSSPVVTTPTAFNVYDTTTSPATSSTGFIQTKIAGQAFTLDIAALDAAGAMIVTPPFNGTVKVELLDSSDNTGALSGSCRSSWTVLQTLPNQDFAASDQTVTGTRGRHRITPNITINNAYKNLRLRVSYPATGTPTRVGCSTDNFAVRPASLGAVSVTDLDSSNAYTGTGTPRTLNNISATGGVVHRAGQPFTVSATAYNSDGTTVSTNYNGSPTGVANTTLPVGGVDGAFTPGTWTANAGTVTSATAEYDEAGVIDLTLEDRVYAAVDSGDATPATCAGYYVCSAAKQVGRFVPNHFQLTDASADPALDSLVDTALDTWLPTTAHQFRTFDSTAAICPSRSFTYLGQPFGYVTPPQATIKAMDANGGWIQNYDFTRLSATGVSQTYSVASGTVDTTLALQSVSLVANANYASGSSIVGTVTVNAADKVALVRGAALAPFNAVIGLSLDIADGSENAVAGNGIINTGGAPVGFAAIPFDAGAQMRFGRLRLSNAHGSEQFALPVPSLVEYFDGANWVNNAADSCTAIALASVTLTKNPAGLATSASLSNPVSAGNLRLKLSKPSARGVVDISVNVPTWLRYDWNTSVAGQENPAARATFGVYKGANEFIYLREAY